VTAAVNNLTAHWLSLVYLGTTGLFLSMMFAALWHLRSVKRLPNLKALPGLPQQQPIRCSVVIAARNEESRIQACIEHLLAQRGVDCEIIIVDDRSSDATSTILSKLSKQYPHVRVKRIETLPDGWLGKCHACHLGASLATGDWILFTDADCWLTPDVIVRAVAAGTRVSSVSLRAWYLLFLTSLVNWFSGVNRDRRGSYLGIGAFNLVRMAAYRECGGYEALRMTVVDDVKLGLLLRRAGKRTRAFLGSDDVECHWGARLRDIVKVMEKNYFAMLNYRVSLVVLGTLAFLLMAALIMAGVFSGTLIGLAAGLASCWTVVPASVLAQRLGWPLWTALGVPFMLPMFLCALLNSTWVTLRQGGVRWRETLYPLHALRAGNVQ
jgi:hypothetical protein